MSVKTDIFSGFYRSSALVSRFSPLRARRSFREGPGEQSSAAGDQDILSAVQFISDGGISDVSDVRMP
jgi:hypothetical protein